MAFELNEYERHYLTTNPEVLLILMDMHDMQQEQADSMEAGCVGDITRWEELRKHGAQIIEPDPGIWSDTVRTAFAEPTGWRAKWIARGSSGNAGVAPASSVAGGTRNGETNG